MMMMHHSSLITHHHSSFTHKFTHKFSPRAPPDTLIKHQRKDGRELGQSSDSGASKLYKKSKWKHKRATHHGMLDFCSHLLPLSSYPTLQKQRNSSTSLYTRSVLLSTSIQHYLHFAQLPSAWPMLFFTLSTSICVVNALLHPLFPRSCRRLRATRLLLGCSVLGEWNESNQSMKS